MKIALAQIQTYKGDISKNIQTHRRFIEQAIAKEADLILFPELSITGYEPELASKLACLPNHSQFDQFQEIADSKKIIIGIGMPTLNENGICISLIIFQPNKQRQVYSKKYLHADEEPFFVSGKNKTNFIKHTKISIAICYELFVEAHTQKAYKDGASIYLASVSKSERGIKKAYKRLSTVAKKNKMIVLMCNNVGFSDNFMATGQSAAWDEEGNLINQLDNDKEGILFIKTTTTIT